MRGVASALFFLVAAILPCSQASAEGQLALIEATKQGDIDTVRKLLADGADPDSHDKVNNTALIFAARDGRLAIARLLIASGAEVDWIDGEGVTPLILASFKDHLPLVKLLLANGAERNLGDRRGRRALDYALRRGPNDPIAKVLQNP